MDDLTNSAIQAALTRDWKKAITFNLGLLKHNPKDTEALNRLARAYFETGFKTKAEETYKKVLRLDKFNSIALKNTEMLKTSRIVRVTGDKTLMSNQNQAMFLEEPGVTRTVSLIRLGDLKIISSCHPGDPVTVTTREHCVSIMSLKNQYLGRLPDDLAARVMNLMKNGNKYEAWIKSVDGLKIFIRETYRGPKNRLTPSFPITEKLTYAAYTPPELVHDTKPDVSVHEEQEEDNREITEVDDHPNMAEIPRAMDD